MNRRELIRLLGGGIAGVPAVKSIEKLSVEPGDTIIVTYMQRVPIHGLKQIEEGMRQYFPKAKIIVMDGNPQIQVIKHT